MKLTEDGKIVVCTVDKESQNAMIKLLKWDTLEIIQEVPLGRVEIEAWDSDDMTLITQKDRNCELFKYLNLQIASNSVIVDFFKNPLTILKLEKGQFTTVSRLETNSEWGPTYITPDGKKMVKIASQDSIIHIWDFDTAKFERALPLKKTFFYWGIRPCVQRNQDTLFFVCQSDVWMLNCKSWRYEVIKKNYSITCFQLSPDGNLAAIVDENNFSLSCLSLHRLINNQVIRRSFFERDFTINFLKFNASHELFISGFNNLGRKAKNFIWDFKFCKPSSIKEVYEVSPHRDEIFGLPNSYQSCTILGNRIIYSFRGSVIIRDLRSLREISNNDQQSLTAAKICQTIVQQKGSIVTLDNKGRVRLFDLFYKPFSFVQGLMREKDGSWESKKSCLRLRARCLE